MLQRFGTRIAATGAVEEIAFDEGILREAVRRRVAEGRLPCKRQDYMWAGKGSGLDCVVCDRPITSTQVEYELQFGGAPNLVVVRMHRPCLAFWESECLETT
jgi:hypothetical protein